MTYVKPKILVRAPFPNNIDVNRWYLLSIMCYGVVDVDEYRYVKSDWLWRKNVNL